MAPIKSNNPYASYFDFFSKSGLDAVSSAPVPEGITATGGIISDYVESGPGDVYRAHVFTNSGTFDVSAIGDHGSNIEYLVVAGGGGGGGHTTAGGGGAGGVRTNDIDEMRVNFLSERAVCTLGANNFFLFQD